MKATQTKAPQVPTWIKSATNDDLREMIANYTKQIDAAARDGVKIGGTMKGMRTKCEKLLAWREAQS